MGRERSRRPSTPDRSRPEAGWSADGPRTGRGRDAHRGCRNAGRLRLGDRRGALPTTPPGRTGTVMVRRLPMIRTLPGPCPDLAPEPAPEPVHDSDHAPEPVHAPDHAPEPAPEPAHDSDEGPSRAPVRDGRSVRSFGAVVRGPGSPTDVRESGLPPDPAAGPRRRTPKIGHVARASPVETGTAPHRPLPIDSGRIRNPRASSRTFAGRSGPLRKLMQNGRAGRGGNRSARSREAAGRSPRPERNPNCGPPRRPAAHNRTGRGRQGRFRVPRRSGIGSRR